MKSIFKMKQNWKHGLKNTIVEKESICLIGHSLGGDLARYLASEFHEVKKLILLYGGYLDLDKILPLDTELEETKKLYWISSCFGLRCSYF